MVLDPADTYLAFTVQGRHFAVPIEVVAGVATVTADEAERLRSAGVFEWQGFYCTAMSIGDLRHDPKEGDTAVVFELSEGRRVVVCEPKTTSKRIERRLPLPPKLARANPLIPQVYWDEGTLVHCLSFDRVAA